MSIPNSGQTICLVRCGVCLENYTTSDAIFTGQCGHLFHKMCLDQWHTQTKTCPICRKQNQSYFQIYLEASPNDQNENNESHIDDDVDDSNVSHIGIVKGASDVEDDDDDVDDIYYDDENEDFGDDYFDYENEDYGFDIDDTDDDDEDAYAA
ncbi:E3 ubiquitin-protein ligase RNF149-like [Drosophila nasuta]|uniref:E3 ubiquitin-protein ligase RNF149-like n=1 Tax=Drosophila nasuta TaxID=42062 RepID=UPI00295F0C19|nr:E3 ubiquitin-protein ligase RNF149-like [Drosophila nasuta]XP_060662056.1 E3 ubiquitin-protein ligase RNF149-like [Drosophila nasuta]XP_060662057.1 E3 ubiquitin-protein ligase RNF149-like [Drosophila nasuta]